MDSVLLLPVPTAVMVVWALIDAISARCEKPTRIAMRVRHDRGRR